MNDIIEYTTTKGDRVLVEVAEPPSGLAPAGGGAFAKAKDRFDDAISAIRPIAEAIMAQLGSLAPNEIEAAFGIKFSAGAGVVLASAGTEASITVTLRWVSPKQA